MQSVYSTAPADWAILSGNMIRLILLRRNWSGVVWYYGLYRGRIYVGEFDMVEFTSVEFTRRRIWYGKFTAVEFISVISWYKRITENQT